jgi:Fe-S cluster assembly scaffold protein SufB
MERLAEILLLKNMDRIILFQYQTSEISVTIEAYFKDQKLIIEGYDIGKSVEKWFGDTDYEYSTTISEEEVKKLYLLLDVQEGDKEGLLKSIAAEYNNNSCYSAFRKFLDENEIKYDSFSWT